MNNIFLDTNIVVDFLSSERVNHFNAKKLIYLLLLNDINIYISEDMLTTIYYVIKEKEKVLNFFKKIKKEWHIMPFGEDIIDEAIEYSLKNSLDFEDLLQCLTAKKYNCFGIVTNDKKFCNCGVKVLGYDEIISMLNEKGNNV